MKSQDARLHHGYLHKHARVALNIQSWILVGILLFTLLLWLLIKRAENQSRSETSSRQIPAENSSQTVHGTSSDSLDLALELAEYFLRQGEKELTRRYICEVREAGSEKQKEQARQLLERLTRDHPIN